jgi:RHS repeat-associated protein
MVPKVPPPTEALSFSANPTDEEFRLKPVFSQGLLPLSRPSTAEENQALASALTQFAGRAVNDDVSAVTQFLQAHPQSTWRASLLTQLGLHYRRTGHFSKALEAWEEAWQLAKGETDANSRTVANQAVGELAALNSRIGRYEQLESLFKEIQGRQLQGSATERIVAAHEGLAGMNNTPENAFRCGPMALDRIRCFLSPADPPASEIFDSKSTRQGFSLAQVQDLARTLKMDYQVAKRQPGAPVLLPAVVHWKVGHYAALLKENAGQYLTQDPTFAEGNLWVSQAALDSEASGYFLVPAGDLPRGWQPVSTDEAKGIWGRGDPSGLPQGPPADCGSGGPGPGGGGGGDSTPGGPGCGMAQYMFHFLLGNLHIADFPVGYRPSVGPDMNFAVSYNHRESQQLLPFSYSNLGTKWTFNWLAYLIDQPGNTNADVSYYGRDGGIATYTNTGSGTFITELYSRTKLTRLSTNSYQLAFPSGGTYTFAQPNTATSNRKVFLTTITDSRGNSASLNYDQYFRLYALRDALGQVTTISYDLTTNSASDDFLKITKVTDPFGRSASFEYTNGHLWRITDVIGLQSAFSYTNSANADFITTMTTPYGTTIFSYGDSGNYKYRWLQATDPLGQTERIETQMDAQSAFPYSQARVNPTGIAILDAYLNYRNCYHWDKKAMHDAPGDYSKATVYHYTHWNGYSMASFFLESMKKPLEGRVWFNYPGQPNSYQSGNLPRPSASGRVLDDGTTQLYKFEWNDFARLTKYTDPANRITIFNYSTNLIDLSEVRQQTGSSNQLLASMTWNSQHLPLTSTDTSGQTNYFGYTTNGLLTSVTNPLGQVINLLYDTNFNLTNISGALPNAPITITYDPTNRIRTVSNSDGYTLTYDYDKFDRLIRITYPDQTYEQIVYDKLDAALLRDRRGHWTTRTYNSIRQLTAVEDPLGRITQFGWCSCGHPSSITDGAGNTTSWIRDIQGRATSKIYPDANQVNYTYEQTTSRLKSVTDAKNQTTTYDYFIDDNLKQVKYLNAVIATPSVSFTYDTNFNRLLTMADGIGTTTYGYNTITVPPMLGAGRLAAITGPLPNSTVSYNYDQLGRMTNRSINGVAETVTIDSLSRPLIITNALGTFSNAYVGGTSRIATNFYPNGQRTEFSYFGTSSDLRLQAIWNRKSNGDTISKFDYAYDPDGEITSWTQQTDNNTPNVWAPEYDSADQLLGVIVHSNNIAGAILKQFAYDYDKAGNRTSELVQTNTTLAPALTSSTINPLNQLLSVSGAGPMRFKGHLDEIGTVTVGGNAAVVAPKVTNFVGYANVTVGTNIIPVVATDYSGNVRSNRYQVVVTNGITRTLAYDLNGNMTSNITAALATSYEWDAANRLTAINAGSNRSEISYDGFGRRARIIEKTNGTVVADHRFLCCGMEFREERDNTGGTATKRFFSQGEQISGTNYFSTRDHLGSLREILDGSAAVRARYDYDTYGRRNKLAGDVEADFGFTGHYFHAPVYLAPLRAYDPDSARWLRRDPIGEFGGPNLYSYVDNSPLGLVDPLGLGSNPVMGAGCSYNSNPYGAGGSFYDPGYLYAPPTSPNPAFSFPFSGGIIASTGAEGGGVLGGGGSASGGAGLFYGPDKGLSVGGFASGGAALNLGFVQLDAPQSPSGTGPMTSFLGRSAGAGSGFWISNASCPADLGGPFDQFNINLIGSFSFAYADGTWIASFTFGKGIGASASYYPTTTPWAGGFYLPSGRPTVYTAP